MKKNHLFILLTALCTLLTGCTALERKQQVGAAVELNGHYLYKSTIDSLTLGLSSEDSLRVAQQYISQWAKDMLLYDAAKKRDNKEIERLAEDYRRTLYVHAYEDYLIDKRMSKTILDSTIVQYYNQMPERFRLDESIMKGLLVVVPTDAPNAKKLRQWLNDVSAADPTSTAMNELMDNIEKYVYQNASGYELFTDKWQTTTQIMSYIPLDRAELENRLKTRNQIEISDSTKTYILQLTDKYMRGQQMPIDYARPEIEKTILQARQVEFLQHERERLYDEAIQKKKINFF